MGQLMEAYTGGMVNLMIDLAHRPDCWRLAAGAGTRARLPSAPGCRNGTCGNAWARWSPPASSTTTRQAPSTRCRPSMRVCLTGDGSLNMAPYSRITTLLGKHLNGVAQSFRDGGGVPYDQFRPEFTSVMDAMSRGLMDGQLLRGILRSAETSRRLPRHPRRRYRVRLRARGEPDGSGVPQVDVHRLRHRRRCHRGRPRRGGGLRCWPTRPSRSGRVMLPTEPAFDAVFAFDSIHDQVDPAGVLRRVHRRCATAACS